jgi:hypothetical protein
MIEERLKKFKQYLNDEVIKKGSKISEWAAAPTIKNLNINISELENLGGSYLSKGLNCSADDKDGDMNKYGDRMTRYINHQEELYLKTTNGELELLYTPDVCNIYGKKINNNTSIYPTTYRLGYYVHQLINNIGNDINENKTIVEIGGGFGTLCYLINKIMHSTYIIIDIPQTLINIGYVLHKYGVNFVFYNEIDNINDIINNKERIVILAPPSVINEINKCDVILAMDCISEFPVPAIDLYVNNINRIKPSIFYTDYTNLANGSYVKTKLNTLEDYDLILDQLTPITAYMSHYKSDEYGKNDIMVEKIYKLKNE